MKIAFRKNDGYTLMELLVTMVTASIVTLAAVTILFLGVRINRQSMDTASRQMTTRILLSSLEDMATEGTITSVASTLDSWQVCGSGGENDILYSYDSESRTIYSGKEGAKTAVMEGVIASDVSMEGQLLTVTVETEDGTYSSSVRCRMNVKAEDSSDEEVKDIFNPENGTSIDDPVQTGDSASLKFLKTLVSQYAIENGSIQLRNPGLILENGASTGKYYSQWYIGNDEWGRNGWNASTPWCACYISWGLAQAWPKGEGMDPAPCFANVDSFMNYLKKGTNGHLWRDSKNFSPKAGDLIFFDWKINSISDPEHIGAVIDVDDTYVYTIEGNSSNRVAVRKYKLSDPRIIGYGIVNWPDE